MIMLDFKLDREILRHKQYAKTVMTVKESTYVNKF